MPHRLEHPIAALFAAVGVLLSFVGSGAHWLADQAHVFTGQPLVGAVTDATLLSVVGPIIAVVAVASPKILGVYSDYRKTKLAQDTAEADTWSGKLRSEVVERAEIEGRLKFANQQIDELKAKVAEVEAIRAKQDVEIRENRHALKNLEQELLLHKKATIEIKTAAVKAGQLAADSRNLAKEQGQRIDNLERATGSSDNIPANG